MNGIPNLFKDTEPGVPGLVFRQFPFIWTWYKKDGSQLTSSSSTRLWRSPTFDFWYADLKSAPTAKAPLARGAIEARHHLVDLYFYFTSPAALAISAGTLLLEGSANAETNDAQADLQTISTIGTTSLRNPSAIDTNMINPLVFTAIRIPCRFFRFTLTLTTTTAGDPTVVYFVNITSRES